MYSLCTHTKSAYKVVKRHGLLIALALFLFVFRLKAGLVKNDVQVFFSEYPCV